MSGTNHEKIIAGFKALNSSSMLYAKSILVAKVNSVDNDNLVQCEADGLAIPDVQLRPISTGSNKSVLVIPKKNSLVLIGSIEGRQEFIVLSVDEAEKVLMKVGDMTLDVLNKEININGKQYDGLVKVGPLADKLNALEKKLNELIVACQSQIVTLAPSGAFPLASFFASVSPLNPTQKNELENSKVKHG